MNWRKFWSGVISRDGRSETEMDTDDDEVTESYETTSTEKSSSIGTSRPKRFYRWLPKECLKLSFLLLNGVILLAGVTAITISIWMLTGASLTSRLLGQQLSTSVLLILGVFVSFVAFTGIIGTARKNTYLMNFYVMCQSIALSAVFVSLTMSIPFIDMMTKKIRDDMINSMENYQSLDWAVEAWDNAHRYLKCCGIKSPKDWLDHRMSIPQSCCSTSIKQCLQMTEDVSYKSGCLKGAMVLLKSYVQTASTSTLVIVPLLLISVLLALSLRKGLKMNCSMRDEAIS